MQSFILSDAEYAEINKKLDFILQWIKGTQSSSDELLTSDELISFLKISNRTLQSYRDKRIIPFYQVGRKTFYKKTEVVKALAQYKSNERTSI